MISSLRRADPDLAADENGRSTGSPTVSDELTAIFAAAFEGQAGTDRLKRSSKSSARRTFAPRGSSHGHRGFVIAAVCAGLFGLCLGAVLEKAQAVTRSRVHDSPAFAALALAPAVALQEPSAATAAPVDSSSGAWASPNGSTGALANPSPLPASPSPAAKSVRRAKTPSVSSARAAPARDSDPMLAARRAKASVVEPTPPSRQNLQLTNLAAGSLTVSEAPPVFGARRFGPAAMPVAAPPNRAGGVWPGGPCGWGEGCVSREAVLRADGQLRQAFSAAERAGVNPEILDALSQNWSQIRYAFSNQPPQLLHGYRQLTESLWQARRAQLSRQALGPAYGPERDEGEPPE